MTGKIEKKSELGWTCLKNASSAQLLFRLNRVLEWATVTVKRAQYDLPLWNTDNNIIRPLEKMILEAALLALVAGRCKDARPSAESLMLEVAKHTDVASKFYKLIRRRPHLRTSLGLLWAAFDNFDCGDADQRRVIQELWEREPSPVQPHERVPYRLLDQAWVSSQVKGKVDPIISSGALLPFTSLGNFNGALFMNRDDLYALTHTAMYTTDFGNWEKPKSYSSDVMGAVGLSRMMDGDFDLAAELIIADILVGGTPISESHFIVRAVLDNVFDSVGLIPSLNFDLSEYKNDRNQDNYLRYHSYHTTFVYALLCYCILQDKRPQSLERRAILDTSEVRSWSYEDMVRLPNPIEDLSTLIARHIHDWTDICRARGRDFKEDGSDLLRSVLDAHLIHAVQNDQVDSILQLLNMSKIGGCSEIDRIVRAYVSQRALLSQAYKEDEALAKKVAAEYEVSTF